MESYNPQKHKLENCLAWLVTLKVDGVQAIYNNGVVTSRSGKPLYNLPPTMPDGTYEVFLGSWDATVSACRTKNQGVPIPPDALYQLEPEIDRRLKFGYLNDTVDSLLAKACEQGYEGLVLRGPAGERLKVKPVETYDVPVTGLVEGKGKHTGRMGALMTPMGKVGTGFTDEDREWFWAMRHLFTETHYQSGGIGLEAFLSPGAPYEKTIIEVECMGFTPAGKFRHPRFLRRRFDK